jgi:co-chaperonin GroES (HSP10)
MKLAPLNGTLIIKVEVPDIDKKTTGGVYLPETSQQKPTTGVVEAVAESYDEDGCLHTEHWTYELVGKTVLFHEHAPRDLPGCEELKLIHHKDLLGVYDGTGCSDD